MTSKQKIDEMLGIPSGQSVDDFLDELTMKGDVEQLSSAFDAVKDSVQQNLLSADTVIKSPEPFLQMSTLTHSMKEVEDLVVLSKNMFKHVYEQIITTDLLDSEVIGSAAKLLESIHINIAEFIGMYRDRQKFIDLLHKMEVQHKYDMEKMAKKQEYDLIKMDRKLDQGAVTVEEGSVNAIFEDMVKMIDKSGVQSFEVEEPENCTESLEESK